jgi:hypothetical protein
MLVEVVVAADIPEGLVVLVVAVLAERFLQQHQQEQPEQ